jgi:hypothetical protein
MLYNFTTIIPDAILHKARGRLELGVEIYTCSPGWLVVLLHPLVSGGVRWLYCIVVKGLSKLAFGKDFTRMWRWGAARGFQ